MEPSDVTQQPRPPSPRNRNRVPNFEHTNRSHHVHHEPVLHERYAATGAAHSRPKPSGEVVSLKSKPRRNP